MSHPSRRTLERFSVDDVAPTEQAELRAHADSCAECRAYLDALAREKDERLQAVPPAAFLQQLRAREAAETPHRRIALARARDMSWTPRWWTAPPR